MDSNQIMKKKGEKTSKKKEVIEGNNNNDGSMSNLRNDTSDPANVLSFGGALENSVDKDQIDQLKQFVRETRKYEGPIKSKSEILDLIDSNANAYSQFNTLTKIKYFYLKHEWTFIAIREFTAIAIIIISFLLYSSSLKVETNYHNYNIYFYYPMTLSSLLKCMSAGIIIGIIIFFMYIKWIFLEHLIYIVIVYIVLISKNYGSNILNHGKYNWVIFGICSILIFLALLSIHMIYRFARTIKYLYLIIAVLALFFGFLICYNFKDKYEQKYSCDKWDITLNSTNILHNKDDKCNIKQPKGYCYMNELYKYFDLTLVNKIKCSNRKETEYLNFYNSIKNENLSMYKIFGFPPTNNIKSEEINNENETKTLNEYVLENIINLENTSLTSEAILDFNSSQYGELKMNLIKNNSLAAERKKIEENNKKLNKNESIYDNVLLIFLSSVSRAHFQRAMPKLSKFISKLMKYEPFPTLLAYEFSKYANFPFTNENFQSIFYKKSKNNTLTNSLSYFKENGFVTGQVKDICEKNFNDNGVEWDHENFAYLCDPNYFQKENSAYERCLYGKPVSEYMINYTTQFFEQYSDNKKYFRMMFNYGNEPTGNVLTYLDEPLYNMLNQFYNTGKLQNTAIFILSEQGNKNNGLYDILGSAEFELEKKYGLFIIILNCNDKFKNGNYHQNLIINQNIMATPYDIYESMIHIAIGNDTFNANNENKIEESQRDSLLNEVKIENRYCGIN